MQNQSYDGNNITNINMHSHQDKAKTHLLGLDKKSFPMIRDEKEEQYNSPDYKFKIRTQEEERNYHAYLQ